MCVCVCVCVYVYMKVDVEFLGCDTFLQDLKFMKNVAKIASTFVIILSRW